MITNRIEKALEKISERLFKEGRQPSAYELNAALGDLARLFQSGLPSMSPTSFGFREKFPLARFNTMMGQVYDDLEFLYEEQFAQISQLLTNLNRSELVYRLLDRRLRTIDASVTDLSLTSSTASLLFSIQEPFNDLTNVDLANTTAHVDLGAGLVTLPHNFAGTKRLAVPHLVDLEGYTINILDADRNPIASDAQVNVGQYRNTKEASTQFRTPFGHAWDDNVSAWILEHRTKETRGIWVEFTVPIVPVRSPLTEVKIGRIDLDPVTSSSLYVQVTTSLDGVNFTRPPSVPNRMLIDGQLSLRFPETLAQYLRVALFVPDAATADSDGFNYYTVGIRNLAMFQMGYAESAILRTSSLSPPDEMTGVQKVSLSVDDDLPENTTISYSVALDTDSPDFIPITPLERAGEGERIVSFADLRTSLRADNRFNWRTTPPTAWTSRFGLNFYTIYGGVKSGYRYRTAQLFRGVNGWHRQPLRASVQERVDIHFPGVLENYNRALYRRRESERAQIISTSSPASIRTQLPIVAGSQGLQVTTPPIEGHPAPDYAIEKVTLYSSSTYSGTFTWVLDSESLSASATYANRAKLEITGATNIKRGDRLSITQSGVTIGFEVPEPPGYDNTTTTVVLNRLTKEKVPDTNARLVDGSVTVAHTARDLTSAVREYSGQIILFNNTTTLSTGDNIEVTYHTPIPRDAELDLNRTVVKAGENLEQVMNPGRDYSIDPDNFTFTIIPGGGITDAHKIELYYTASGVVMETFRTYVRVSAPTEVNWPGIEVDTESNEAVSLLVATRGEKGTATRQYDLSRQQTFILPPGTHQVTCNSRAIENASGAVATNCAIYRLVNAQVDSSFFFRPGNFFSSMTAYVEPMVETTRTFLEGSSRYYDRKYFVIDGTDVVINYDPSVAVETFYLQPQSTYVEERDDFELMYQYLPTVPTTSNLLFKAELKRPPERPDVTPVLRSFSLRLA